MAELADGDSIEVQGSSSPYTIARRGDVYSCTCPAWQFARVRIEDRQCKHVRAFLGDYYQAEAAPIFGVPEYDEFEGTRARREAALTDALERFVVLHDRMEESFGLRMPEELAYLAGFFAGLDAKERAYLTDGEGLLGPAKWFDVAGSTKNVADERLRDRERDDLPEFVPVMTSRRGKRFGLWYDDPRELPNIVLWEKEMAFGVMQDTTILRCWLNELLYPPVIWGPGGVQQPPDVVPEDPRHLPVIAWLGEVCRRERRVERTKVPRRGEPYCLGRIPPMVPGFTIPALMIRWDHYRHRRDVYETRSPEHDAELDGWIEGALRDLKDGAIGPALLYGRELHLSDIAKYRTACSELLVRSYVQLGRRALADLTRAHYLARDPEIPVFEMPPPHAIVVAAASEDPAEVLAALSGGDSAPSGDEISEALACATTVEGATAILELDPNQSDSALMRRLWDIAGRPREHVRTAYDLAELFLKRGYVSARAFGRLLVNVRDEELTKLGVERVDVFAEDALGATPLHLAAIAARPDIVKALLARNADASAEDNRGRTAYEAARGSWRNFPREVGEIFALLDAAGGGEKKKKDEAPPAEWTVGMTVKHAKFGEGVVEEVSGVGEETKLKIAFAPAVVPGKAGTKPKKGKAKPEYKTLLAKFVSK